MLTATRKSDEGLIIITPKGEEISVVIHDIQKDHVKVSIDASHDYVIKRDEYMIDDVTFS